MEFAKYSFRMMHNAAESIMLLVTILVQEEDVSFYNRNLGGVTIHGGNSSGSGGGNGEVNVVHMSQKTLRVMGLGSANHGTARYEVIPLWKKICQYRDRVLGMYHDVLHCLLVNNGDGVATGPSDGIGGLEKLTKYGNNILAGNVGNLIDVSPKARADGELLLKKFENVLEDLDRLQSCSKDYLESSLDDNRVEFTSDGKFAAQRLMISIADFQEFLVSIDPVGVLSSARNDDSDEDSDDDHIRHPPRKSIIREGYEMVKTVLGGMLDMCDPPPLLTIFGLDALRGSMLSRYRGSQQFWIPRGKSIGDGSIDAIHIPANKVRRNLSTNDPMQKVVLFCNPNAGLLEVATGLSLTSGNVPGSTWSELSCWTDFYLENGYDVIVYNYVGYGRSHMGKPKTKGDFSRGLHILRRIIVSSLFGFKPSPASLKADATVVATHIIEKMGVDKFVIHGESIGGMAASGAANAISKKNYTDKNSLPITYPTMLLCDRTFCNLNATAYRLVGSWTSSVIPLLTPFWNTDVAADYSSARCRKVVAQDAADVIIHDCASLKKGIATAKEITKGKTSGLGTFGDAPLTYRMADYEDVGVRDSRIVRFPFKYAKGPSWPADKHMELSELYHFAACARWIGRMATNIRKNQLLHSVKQPPYEDEDEGIEITAVFSRDAEGPEEATGNDEDVILKIWETLGRCDGLCGFPLGAAVKDGYDCAIDWLSCMITLGSQRVALAAESRQWVLSQVNKTVAANEVVVQDIDFEFQQNGYKKESEDVELVPMPLPEVIRELQKLLDTFRDVTDEEHPCKQGKNGHVFLIFLAWNLY